MCLTTFTLPKTMQKGWGGAISCSQSQAEVNQQVFWGDIGRIET